MSAAGLTAARRAALAALCEVVAPRTARMPSAGDLGLAEPGGELDRVLALRPDLVAPLCRVLDLPEALADPHGLIQRLQDKSGDAFAAIMQAVAGAYYLHSRVRALIFYNGQEAQSLDRGAIGGEEFLAIMMERPARWRGATASLKHLAGAGK